MRLSSDVIFSADAGSEIAQNELGKNIGILGWEDNRF